MFKLKSITTLAMALCASFFLLTEVQAAKSGGGGSTFCPCFTSTIIDATIAEGGGSGVRGLLDGTIGSFGCEDTGDAVNLRINGAGDMNISVFGDLTYNVDQPRCGWSGRPVNVTTQEAAECQNQIKQSWAWKVLACPGT